ncbi:MAG: phage portal protein [Patescibacteria group bacterium]|nr:phage portal protein [Patescibacteria group bacterium]
MAGKTTIDPATVSLVASGGFRALIRNVSESSWFGPLQPLAPVAPAGTPPRELDYPFGYNLNVLPRASEAVSFADLRNLADGYDLLRIVIETRKDQVAKVPWTVRIKAKQGLSGRKVQEMSAADARVKSLIRLLQSPDGENSWQTWIRAALEDVFVTDALSILPIRGPQGVEKLRIIDGATISRKIDTQGFTPEPPSIAYQQIIKGLPAVDLTTDDLIYRPRNVRSHKIYGYSPVEQIIVTVNLAIRRQLFQLGFYTEGNIPEAIVSAPDTWTPDQVKQMQVWFDATLSGNLAQRRKLTLVPAWGGTGNGKADIVFPKAAALKDEMDEWLARVVCFAFSIPPTPFVKQMNRATAQQAQQTALQEGLAPILDWSAALINRDVIEGLFGFTDIEFAYIEDRETDALQQANIDAIYVKAGVKSIDEVRSDLGLDPVGVGNGIVTATGFMPIGDAAEEAQDEDDEGNAGTQKLLKAKKKRLY